MSFMRKLVLTLIILFSPVLFSCDSSTGGPSCCKECTNGKPCGDSCIPKESQCTKGGGCACSTAELEEEMEELDEAEDLQVENK